MFTPSSKNSALLIISLFLTFTAPVNLSATNFSSTSSTLSICASLLAKGKLPELAKAITLSDNLKLKDLNARFEIKDIAKLANEILRKYPANNHYFLGLGRSPFAVIDYLNLVSAQSATTIPLSYNFKFSAYLRFFVPRLPEQAATPAYSTGKNRDLLFQFFEHFVPEPTVIGDRKIVLIDYSELGTSLAKFYIDLTAYFKARGIHNPVEILFLDERNRGNAMTGEWANGRWFNDLLEMYNITSAQWGSIDLAGNHENFKQLVAEQILKPFAPYPHFTIQPRPAPFHLPKPNAAHEIFLKALQNEFTNQQQETKSND